MRNSYSIQVLKGQSIQSDKMLFEKNECDSDPLKQIREPLEILRVFSQTSQQKPKIEEGSSQKDL